MSTPSSSYRLQVREHLDFEGAARLAPYLAQLGISHLYLAPVCSAMPGSTHGYDGIDFNAIEPALGGMEGFRALVAALHAEGLKLIVDFVPNHMAASPLNPWWRDVLEWGQASAWAQHFDVDWTAAKLLVPVLGETYASALDNGHLKLRLLPDAGGFALSYHDIALPLTPRSYAFILSRIDLTGAIELSRRFALAAPDTTAELKAELGSMIAGDGDDAFGAAMAAIQEDGAALHELHEAQVWRLAHWRTSRESLTYRRFFEIADLVGVRVELPSVFDDVHRCVLSLVSDGAIDGLRIDHVDGLADPLAYLNRLQMTIGRPGFYLAVEKILEADEALPSQWPVAGTTGYEFIRELAALFVAGNTASELSLAYAKFVGADVDYREMVASMKRRTLTRNLAGELDVLASQAYELAQRDLHTRDFGRDTLRRAIIEMATALPVYRTYVDAAGARPRDLKLLEQTAARARTTREVEDEAAIDFVLKILTLDLPAPEAQGAALTFAIRFQQTTGPLVAKAIEDTLFYRFNRLIGLNEVGGEPDMPGGTLEQFHEAMQVRLRDQPGGMTSTSTHDTKRGEDARTRIYTISECPGEWSAAVERWSALNDVHCSNLPSGPAPEPEMLWFFYQSLVGAWPADLDPEDEGGVCRLRDRIAALMHKAAREAKVRTSWAQPSGDYEAAVDQFVKRVLDPRASKEFLRDFLEVARPMFVAGALVALSQLTVKLAAPGVPDVYQGTEFWDLSLVDPDNRSKIDFDRRRAALATVCERSPADLLDDWSSGAIKLRLLQAGLALRRHLQGWEHAEYVPLQCEGSHQHHVVAFARVFDEAAVIVVSVRLPLELLRDEACPMVSPQRWGDTALLMPARLERLKLVDAITREPLDCERRLLLRKVLRHFPVALLTTHSPHRHVDRT
jgi:(1->4)-alpha-D-glucan 1-alpha-D-glucosylmutase